MGLLLVDQVYRVINSMENMGPGKRKPLDIPGYELAAGAFLTLIQDELRKIDSPLNFNEFQFDWDQDHAQQHADALIAFTITRIAN